MGKALIRPILPDGSSRRFYRVFFQNKSLLLIHNPCNIDVINENDSYWYIGKHLYNKGIPVPALYLYEREKGIIWLEDLGDIHLQKLIDFKKDPYISSRYYEQVLEIMLKLNIEGKEGFDPVHCYDTPYYDFKFILERELLYFYKEFLLRYEKVHQHQKMKEDFFRLASVVSKISNSFLIHRDFQSRNIMIREGKPYIIDFQGARFGPLTYDLASLLIDPYVCMPEKYQLRFVKDFFLEAKKHLYCCWEEFLELFWHTALCRNLQVLGAFSYLSFKKKKCQFKKFISPALNQVRKILEVHLKGKFSALRDALFY